MEGDQALSIEPRASRMLGKSSAVELHPQPLLAIFKRYPFPNSILLKRHYNQVQNVAISGSGWKIKLTEKIFLGHLEEFGMYNR